MATTETAQAIDDEEGRVIDWTDRSEAAPPVLSENVKSQPAGDGRVGGRPSTRPTDLLVRRMSQMPTQIEEKVHVDKVHGKGSKRAALLEFLHSKSVQWTLMGLLLLDVFLLFIEMFLSASYPFCYIIERDCISCCPPSPSDLYYVDDHADAEAHRVLAGDSDGSTSHDDTTCVANWTAVADQEHIRFLAEAKDEDGSSHVM